MDSMCKLKIKRGNRHIENKHLLKLMPSSDLHQSTALKNVDGRKHNTFVTSDRVWASNKNNNIMLTNKTGVSDRKNNIMFTNTTSDTLQRKENF